MSKRPIAKVTSRYYRHTEMPEYEIIALSGQDFWTVFYDGQKVGRATTMTQALTLITAR